ncbi:hypothetical protein R1flu_027563 [Riccia fluitans]|uniref:Pectinesterase n=1 Tax=Riccia fluitans TaxID=41844 RepID=A0ABD1XJ56_9MARC
MAGALRYDAPNYYDQHGKSKKRRWCLVVTGVIVLVAVICAIAIPISLNNNKDKNNHSGPMGGSSGATGLQKACNQTLYYDVCMQSLRDYPNANSSNPLDLVKIALYAASESVSEELERARELQNQTSSDGNLTIAATACMDNLVDSLDEINQTMDRLDNWDVANLENELADLQTWMSAALTLEDTCRDGFQDLNVTGPAADEFLNNGTYVQKVLSNALAFINILRTVTNNVLGRRLLMERSSRDDDPSERWIGSLRRLLQTTQNITVDVTVALDGSGKYKKIQDAVDSAPEKSKTRYVIRIKAGKYKENVIVDKSRQNIMFIGDGQGKTIITGSKSVVGSGVTTSLTGTLTVLGKGFIGRDFTVENTAGAINHQAVALRVNADMSAFWRCTFTGFQDTLYTHAYRQFYKQCTVTGTVDFIFGNAAVVLQDCTILADVGIQGQQNTYTAQGRLDPNMNTGISFHKCTIDATPALKKATSPAQTFLGRPWKPYAVTVFMQSTLGSIVDPTGWMLWNGDTTRSSTVYYAEYKNTGAGSGTSKRVNWSFQITNPTVAQKFTPNKLLSASSWLNAYGIPYTGTL